MPNNGALNKSLAINGTYAIPAGYTSGGNVTQSIPTKAAATITPATSDQTIAGGQYLTGTQTILGDSDLIASNIRNGVNIFGVAGSVVPSGYKYASGTVTATNENGTTTSSSYRFANLSGIGWSPKLIVGVTDMGGYTNLACMYVRGITGTYASMWTYWSQGGHPVLTSDWDYTHLQIGYLYSASTSYGAFRWQAYTW